MTLGLTLPLLFILAPVSLNNMVQIFSNPSFFGPHFVPRSRYREAGEPQPDADWAPHGGGGFFNFRGNSHIYQMEKQKIHAGLVRCVWELTDVAEDSGGTHFIPGSHKAAFVRPPSPNGPDSKFFKTYACPAGSAVIFTESLTRVIYLHKERGVSDE